MPTIVSMGVHILDVLGRHVSEIPPGQNIALIDEIRITAAGTAAGTSVGAGSTGGSDGGGTGEEFGGGVGAPDLDPPIDLRGTSCGSLLGGVDCAIAIDVTAMTVQRIERISER